MPRASTAGLLRLNFSEHQRLKVIAAIRPTEDEAAAKFMCRGRTECSSKNNDNTGQHP